MFDGIIVSLFMLVPVVGIFISSLFTMFLKNTKLLIIEQFGSVSLFLLNMILIIFMLISLNQNEEISSTLSSLFSITIIKGLILLLVQFVFTLVAIYSISYISKEKQAQFFIFFFSLNIGINLTLLANNLFVLFVSWELMVISGYVLVSFNRTINAFEAGFKYLIISSIGSLFMLLGIGFLTGLVQSLDYTNIKAEFINGSLATNTLGILSLAFIVIGFATTGGAFLLNQWLPDAHPEAPAPISAILSGIVVNIGIYGLYTVFSIFSVSNADYNTNISNLILLLGIVTMFEGSLMVFVQFKKEFIDIKRILAYSTITHMGLLITITPLNSSLGLIALIYHIFSHSISKSLLFLIAGYLQLAYNTRNVRDLAGVGRKDKVLGVFIIIGLLSLGAFPGTTGFISELLIFISIFSSGFVSNYYIFLLVLLFIIFNSVLSFGGYLWLMKYLVFNEESSVIQNIAKPLKNNYIISFVMAVLVASILILGLLPQLIINFINSNILFS